MNNAVSIPAQALAGCLLWVAALAAGPAHAAGDAVSGPPSQAGAVNATDSDLSPGVIAPVVGTSGTVRGIPEIAFDSTPVAKPLTARILTL